MRETIFINNSIFINNKQKNILYFARSSFIELSVFRFSYQFLDECDFRKIMSVPMPRINRSVK